MPKRNIVWIIIGAVIAVLLWKWPETYLRRDALYTQFSPLVDVRVQVINHYVEEVKDDVLLHGAIDGMLARLDPYSAYFTEDEYREVEKWTDGQFPGIGVEVATPPNIGLVVVSPIEGSPAFHAGLRPGDRITYVDGVETAGLALDRCVKMITGQPGTQVHLTIMRPDVDEPIEVTITRSLVNVPTVRGWARTGDWQWDYVIDAEQRIGYIRILRFDRHTAEQFNDIALRLLTRDRVRGLILDVRDNGGGLLDQVVIVADRFISEGKIVSTKGRRTPEVPYLATPQGDYPKIPTAILVNGGSASASEILAGALRDHNLAFVVGEKTFGKGSVQKFLQVENGNGKIKLTTEYYYLPKGERIHGKGITPDHVVELTREERTALVESWMAVYSTGQFPTTTQATTATAPVQPPERQRFEIPIDPQLEEALKLVRERLAEPQTGRLQTRGT